MKFEQTKVMGIENALVGMRLPMSKDSDEAYMKAVNSLKDREASVELGKKLIRADSNAKGHGQPNSKFLRMIHVQVAVTAPLYWWKEFDTYKVGTTANSTSTMHKIASYPITKECFEMGDFSDVRFEEDDDCYGILNEQWDRIIYICELLRQKYNETKDKRYWKELIRLLPESWLQTRMVDLDYQTLRNMWFWRHSHKLTEWHSFCHWIKGLPYASEWLYEEEK